MRVSKKQAKAAAAKLYAAEKFGYLVALTKGDLATAKKYQGRANGIAAMVRKETSRCAFGAWLDGANEIANYNFLVSL